jgi:hypothetical protein
MSGEIISPDEAAHLPLLPIAIPPWKGSHPFSRGEAVRRYRPQDLKMRAGSKQARTAFFEKTLYGIWTALGAPVPYGFRTADGAVRSLDAGCLGFLYNSATPEIRVSTDDAGFITAVEPAEPLVARYQQIASSLASSVRAPGGGDGIRESVATSDRLPVAMLEKVSADHIWRAVQALLSGHSKHPFGDSMDFDVVCDGGRRLAPKAVFGIAASEALGFDVLPKHFTGGIDTPCFRAIEAAGFEIVRKNAPGEPDLNAVLIEEWTEGGRKLIQHLRADRARGLAAAKKAQFIRAHGRLYCERCGFDPASKYDGRTAEACIEVHHRTISVAKMGEGHTTRLEDVACLCANCHRVTHRELRLVADFSAD